MTVVDEEWDYDIEPEEFECSKLVSILFVAAVFGLLFYGVDKYLMPPVNRFPPPVVEFKAWPPKNAVFVLYDTNEANLVNNEGWLVQCISIDREKKIVRPYWENPNCKPNFQGGEWHELAPFQGPYKNETITGKVHQ